MGFSWRVNCCIVLSCSVLLNSSVKAGSIARDEFGHSKSKYLEEAGRLDSSLQSGAVEMMAASTVHARLVLQTCLHQLDGVVGDTHGLRGEAIMLQEEVFWSCAIP